jgi:hypothetical protein
VTPTLFGRIQTRVLLMLLVGLPWTLLVSLVLPRPTGAELADVYEITLKALAFMTVIGAVVWEPIYHGLQQFRWEKDWPTMFGLLTVVNEAAVIWFVLDPRPSFVSFAIHVGTTWLLVWLVAIGPLKIFLLRWRFRGGRWI